MTSSIYNVDLLRLADDGFVTVDIGLYDYVVIQVVGLSGKFAVNGTNFGINSADADYYTALTITDLSDNSATTEILASGIYRVDAPATRYLQIAESGSVTADKIILFMSKIY